MNCEQAHELVGAYAVDALTAEEATAFAAHIATCQEHARQAADLRAVAAHLPDTVEPIEPPPALRARLLEAIDREPQADNVTSVTSTAAARERRAERQGSDGWWKPNAWTAIAAALALFGAAAGIWAVWSGGDSDADELASAATGVGDLVDTTGARVGTVVFFEDDRQATVFFDNLPDAGDGQSYQMWAVSDGGAVSIAVMEEGTSGAQTSVVDFDPAASDALAITIEPAGGSAQPTSEPVFVAET